MDVFRTSGLIPDVLDEVPPAALKIKFGNAELRPGDTQTPTNVKDVPSVTIEQDASEFFTLICHDPDAPSREDPKFGEFQHWLVMNITNNDINTGEELTTYIGSGAPKGTGLHRYIFLLFKQTNGKIETKDLPRVPNNTADGRRLQKARDIAKRFNLQLAAGNFCLAEWDDYVPVLHAQLGDILSFLELPLVHHFPSVPAIRRFPLGILTQKTGERWLAVAGAVLLAIGMLSSMFATGMTAIYFTYGLIAGLGSGTIHYCGNTILGPHFNDKWRPVAMTVANAGIPLSTLILPPVMTVLIEKFDWRKTFMFLSLLSLIGIPSGLTFFPPEKVTVEGDEHMVEDPFDLKTALIKLLKNMNYVLYATASFVAYFGLFLPATFLPDLMYEADRSSTEVYIIVMVLGATDFCGRLLFGAISHKVTKLIPFVHSFGLLLFSIGTALLTLASSFISFIALAAVLGLGAGGFNGLHSVMAAHVVPVSQMRLAYGLVISLGGIPMLSGMPLAGLISDSYGNQRGAYIFSACLFGLGALITCLIGIREICGQSRIYEF